MFGTFEISESPDSPTTALKWVPSGPIHTVIAHAVLTQAVNQALIWEKAVEDLIRVIRRDMLVTLQKAGLLGEKSLEWGTDLVSPPIKWQPGMLNAPKYALLGAIPGLKDATTTCPGTDCTYVDGNKPQPLYQVIMHLNDIHRWTREQIADWVETLDFDLYFQTPKGGDK